jgi:hypothetical protein
MYSMVPANPPTRPARHLPKPRGEAVSSSRNIRTPLSQHRISHLLLFRAKGIDIAATANAIVRVSVGIGGMLKIISLFETEYAWKEVSEVDISNRGLAGGWDVAFGASGAKNWINQWMMMSLGINVGRYSNPETPRPGCSRQL